MDQTSQEKSLMISLERLNGRAEMLEELTCRSRFLVEKLERTDDQVDPSLNQPKEKLHDHQDLIDMFNNVDSKIEQLINQISRDIEKVIAMIG